MRYAWLRGAVLVGMATCTPQQRPWVFPVSGSTGPVVAPPDRALRLVVEGDFPQGSLRVTGRDAAGTQHVLAVTPASPGFAPGGATPAGPRRFEIGVPPGVTVGPLALVGGCSGCRSFCDTPPGLSARLVSAEASAFWTATAAVPPRPVTLLRPGGHARFTLSLAASQLPSVELAVDSPRFAAGEAAFAQDGEHLVGRVQGVWPTSPGRYQALVVLRNGKSGHRVDPVSFRWSATAKLLGACPGAEGSCAPPPDAGVSVEGVTEECCRDGRESGGEDIVCRARGEVKRVGPGLVAYCEREAEDAGRACASSAECRGWCTHADGAGRCSATEARPPCFASWENGAKLERCD